MSPRPLFLTPQHPFKQQASGLSERASGALTGVAAVRHQNALAATWVQVSQGALRKAGDFTRTIPVPAIVRKHVSKRDAAFIAAAYAIPLPGTALIAAAIVGSRLGYRHWRGRLQRDAAVNAFNG
jgi:hypothetical protein